MSNSAEEIVSNYYNTIGWETDGEATVDARLCEDLREYAAHYVSRCRLRVLRHIPETGVNILDMASGPIQYKEYLEYSRNFKKRYCIDFSSKALEKAKEKIGDHGVLLLGSFFDIPLEEDFFDCAISLHTIYHIDKDKQAQAVHKLLYVTKPGKPVIIVYSNPNTFVSFFKSLLTFCSSKNNQKEKQDPYFYAHPIKWWDRFSDIASIKILPWRSFDSAVQKKLIPNNKIGEKIFDLLLNLEEKFPKFFVKHFQYPMVILTKRL